MPFALGSLQTKVAGARKYTELVKLAKAGREPLLAFLQLAFGRALPSAVRAHPHSHTHTSTHLA